MSACLGFLQPRDLNGTILHQSGLKSECVLGPPWLRIGRWFHQPKQRLKDAQQSQFVSDQSDFASKSWQVLHARTLPLLYQHISSDSNSDKSKHPLRVCRSFPTPPSSISIFQSPKEATSLRTTSSGSD